MGDRVSLKMPKRFLERFETFQGHYGYRSFNRFCESIVQTAIEEHERRFEIHQFEHEKIKRMESDAND